MFLSDLHGSNDIMAVRGFATRKVDEAGECHAGSVASLRPARGLWILWVGVVAEIALRARFLGKNRHFEVTFWG
jgi:hypothetical protein